jgi:hypothetical protein
MRANRVRANTMPVGSVKEAKRERDAHRKLPVGKNSDEKFKPDMSKGQTQILKLHTMLIRVKRKKTLS